MNAPANVGEPMLAIRKSYKASAAAIFEAFTKPEALNQWFGAYDRPVASSVDLTVGGAWSIEMEMPSGETATVSGKYLEIVPGKRLVYTWAWGGTPDRVSQVAIDLAEHGEETQLTLTHTKFYDEAARDGHHQGWEACLKNLPDYLETLA
ncbi:MAG: SRPBCC family protein [Pseudomonadota bacterium]